MLNGEIQLLRLSLRANISVSLVFCAIFGRNLDKCLDLHHNTIKLNW